MVFSIQKSPFSCGRHILRLPADAYNRSIGACAPTRNRTSDLLVCVTTSNQLNPIVLNPVRAIFSHTYIPTIKFTF